MKATGKHKDIRSRQARQSSYHYRMITRAVKAVAIIIGAVIGIALWAIARPILRGIGWLISILTCKYSLKSGPGLSFKNGPPRGA